MQRFFLPDLTPKVDDTIALDSIHHQLRHVLRVQAGAQLILLDNAGYERLIDVVSINRHTASGRVVEVRPAPGEAAVSVTLYQCILKSDKFEFVLQKATELGVAKVVPVISQRTVARPGRALEAKLARWEKIVREAAEQSRRGALPVVAPVCVLPEAIGQATGARLLPWEEGEANPGLLGALKLTTKLMTKPLDAVSVLIGPEGGFEAGEVNAAVDAGWQVVTLGQRTLRAETAAIAALSVVMGAVGALGDAPLVKVALPTATPGEPIKRKKAARRKAKGTAENTTDDEVTAQGEEVATG